MLHHRRLKCLREALLFVESELLMIYLFWAQRVIIPHHLFEKMMLSVCVCSCTCYILRTNILKQSEDIVGKVKVKVRGLVGMV